MILYIITLYTSVGIIYKKFNINYDDLLKYINYLIKRDPFQIIFIESNCDYEICKLSVSKNGYALKYVIPELKSDEI